MTLYKLIGVPKTAGLPGFELLYDAPDPANAALIKANEARRSEGEGSQDVELVDSFGSTIGITGPDWLFFMLQDVAQSLDGKNEDQIAQMKAQRRGQIKADADREITGTSNLIVPNRARLDINGRGN